MKKFFAILMTLCLLCAACTAMADLEIPTFDSMPGVVLEDGDTTVDEAAFEGNWVLRVAFAGEEYVDEQTLAGTYGFNFMPYRITKGMILQDLQDENGEFHTVEMPYTFEAGQLQGTDAEGRGFAVELLEDGNIVMSTFYPGAGDEVICLSVFLVHPAE
ncbi:MAG: hypothetical protein IKH38_04805 [Clostridia bacterium]|nr:hypothetical protein [Clostridia bacterium]